MTDSSSDDAPERETAWERRRRLAAVFGDDLPSVTSDEASLTNRDTDHGTGPSAADRWLTENRPPHHE
ncbi:hypothetical protein GCM10009773_26700 [Williamsia serinedens]